ncbi:MAG: helicase-related protein, partial [Candidatus Nanoarchaeia archaeon]
IMIRNLRRDTNIYFVNRDVKTLLLDYSPEEFKFYTHVVQFIKRRYESIKKECIPPDKKEGLSKEELKKIADKYRQRGLLTFKLISLTRQITSSIKTGIKALKNYRETLEDTKEQRYLDSLIEEGKRIDKDKKVEALKSLLKKEKKKVIIFTTFLNTQKIIDEELMMMGFKTVLFNGKMNSREKENAIRRFKEDGQILITTDAGSEGRNLQFAHILINFDLPWNPMRIEQRIGRVHRIGQTKDVRIINMSINETVEAYILNRLYEKIDMFHTAIGEMDLIISQLSSKNSLEQDIFESFMEDDVDKLGDALIRAKEGAESIKEFDSKIFDKNGSRTA